MSARTYLAFCALAAAALLAACSGTPAPAPEAPATTPETDPADAPEAPGLPSAAEVLDAYVEATGGRAAYEALQSVVTRGSIEIPQMGVKGTLVTYSAPPRKAFASIELPGLGTMERGTDGEIAWERSAMAGARVLDGQERDEMLRQSTFGAELAWRELYERVEVVGIGDVDGEAAYELLFTTPEGTTETRFYAVESRLLLRSEMVMHTQMGEIPSTSRFLDYRQEGPFVVPGRVDQHAVNVTQVMVFDRVEHDAEIPDGTLEVPAEIRALVKP